MFIHDETDLLAALDDHPGVKRLYLSSKRTKVWAHIGTPQFHAPYSSGIREVFRGEHFSFFYQRYRRSVPIHVLSVHIGGEPAFTEFVKRAVEFTKEELRAIDVACYIFGADLRQVPKNL